MINRMNKAAERVQWQTALAALLRIVAGYIGACLAGGFCLFVTGFLFFGGAESSNGGGLWAELLSELPWIAVFAAFISVLALPVAIPGIIITELVKLRAPAVYAAVGALAVIPALFRGNYHSAFDMAEGFMTLAPAGITAGLAFWLVRHRLWTTSLR